MNLDEYRRSPREQERTRDLLKTIAELDGHCALDVGARDGHFSRLLSATFPRVTALDVERPQFDHPGVSCVKGDITQLEFANATFDLVLCTEVLEHIPPQLLGVACSELARVTRRHLIVGVPFKQDLRVGRTLCLNCGKRNPPWGHVNRFDLDLLKCLFPRLEVVSCHFVGMHREITNPVSSVLNRWAGDPFGTYGQEEVCIHCGVKLLAPKDRSIVQRMLTRTASEIDKIQRRVSAPRPIWIHLLFSKP